MPAGKVSINFNVTNNNLLKVEEKMAGTILTIFCNPQPEFEIDNNLIF